MSTEVLDDNYDAITHSHTAATTAKATILIGAKPLIPLNTVLADIANVFVTRAAVVRVPKNNPEAWTILQPIYWDDTAKEYTNVSTSNTLAGHAAAVAASADTEGVIDFNPLGVVA